MSPYEILKVISPILLVIGLWRTPQIIEALKKPRLAQLENESEERNAQIEAEKEVRLAEIESENKVKLEELRNQERERQA